MAEEKKENYWKKIAKKQREEIEKLKGKSSKGNDIWPIISIILSIFLVASLFGAAYLAMRYSDVNSNYQSLKTSFESLEDQKDSLLLERKTLTDQISTLNSQIEGLQTEKTQLSSQVTDLQTEVSTLEEEKKEKEDELTQKNAEIDDLEAEVASLNNSVEKYKTWIDQYKSTIDELNAQLGQTSEEVKDLEDVIAQCIGCGISCVDIEASGDPTYNASTNATTQYYNLFIYFDTDCTTCGSSSTCTSSSCGPCYDPCCSTYCCPHMRVRLRVVYDLDTDTFSTTVLSWYWCN